MVCSGVLNLFEAGGTFESLTGVDGNSDKMAATGGGTNDKMATTGVSGSEILHNSSSTLQAEAI